MKECKTLKFDSDLVPLILEGKKTTTWRINDEKNISIGDILSLIKRPQLEEFGQAVVISSEVKQLKNLSQEEKGNNNKLQTDQEMYQSLSNAYGIDVISETEVKVIKFRLL